MRQQAVEGIALLRRSLAQKIRAVELPFQAGQRFTTHLDGDRSSTPEEVKLRYRDLARRWHPDSCDEEAAEENMKAINNAYEAFCG